MHLQTVSYVLLGALAIALLVAAFTDIRRRQIDNWLTASVALAAPLFWWTAGMGWYDIGWQLGVAVAAFAGLALLFAMRAMGGGDVKLLTALALWIRPAFFLELVMLMALLGGVLTVAMGAWHIARRQRDRLLVPYGIAISAAGLWVLASDYWPIIQAGGRVG
ncbi:MAG: prepilin peptidase [Proteobacteria bacterium]|nr:prepilin peptidase [Pseudomonadota bacterium]